MKILLFDTNFLLLPELDGIDIFDEIRKIISEEHELVTLSSIVDELLRLKESKSKRGVAANVALGLLRKNKVKVLETSLKADPSVLDYALTHPNVIVCTNDRELKSALRKGKIQVISPKGRNYLTFT